LQIRRSAHFASNPSGCIAGRLLYIAKTPYKALNAALDALCCAHANVGQGFAHWPLTARLSSRNTLRLIFGLVLGKPVSACGGGFLVLGEPVLSHY
jgi:hypothetical protein